MLTGHHGHSGGRTVNDPFLFSFICLLKNPTVQGHPCGTAADNFVQVPASLAPRPLGTALNKSLRFAHV